MLPLLLGAQAAEPILIGEIDSRTGILAAQGLAIAEGVRIAIDAVNAAGGVGGRPLRLLERDDKGKAERAIAAAEELVARHGVVGLVGGYVDSGSDARSTSPTGSSSSSAATWRTRLGEPGACRSRRASPSSRWVTCGGAS